MTDSVLFQTVVSPVIAKRAKELAAISGLSMACWVRSLIVKKCEDPTPRELRDKFAGQAMQSLILPHVNMDERENVRLIAELAYKMADAMVSARTSKPTRPRPGTGIDRHP